MSKPIRNFLALLASLAFTTTVYAQPSADVRVSNHASPDAVVAFDSFSYLMTVSNAGPDQAQGVELVSNLPTTVSTDSFTTDQGNCILSTHSINCAFGSIPAGGAVNVRVEVTSLFQGTIYSTATASAVTADPDMSNNEARATVQVVQSAADLPEHTISVMTEGATIILVVTLMLFGAFAVRRHGG